MPDINAQITEPEEINVTVVGGTTTFRALSDTPSTYVGQAGKIVSVKSTEDEVEFITNLGGDVVGPSSAVDNSIVTFDSTTGKLVQDSGLISEGEKIYQPGFPTSYIIFNSGTIEIWAGGIKQAQWG